MFDDLMMMFSKKRSKNVGGRESIVLVHFVLASKVNTLVAWIG